MSDQVRLCRYVECRKVLVRKNGEKPSHFSRRETCDLVCSNKQKALDRVKNGKQRRAAPVNPLKKDKSDVLPVEVTVLPCRVPVDDRGVLNQVMLRERMFRVALL